MLEICAHFEHFGKACLTRFFGTEQFDVTGPIRPFGQLASVFPREIKQQCKHLRGEFNRYEINPVKSFAHWQRIEQFRGAAADIARHAFHLTGRESGRNHAAFLSMLWPVHRNEHWHDHFLVFRNRLRKGVVVD